MGWIILLAIIAAFLLFVSRKPDMFSVERSINIDAPAHQIFGWINNMKRFNDWNPWLQSEPTSVLTYSGPEEGPQASYAWVGKKSGQGKMTVTAQRPPHEVNFELNFVKPFKADNNVNFTLREGNGTTVVIWAMSGTNAFLNKLFQTFVNMDKMVGKDFEKGLANLKALVEAKKLS